MRDFLSKFKRGVCPECKVKEGNSSEKTLYQCKLCERWFCARHIEPRLAFIRDLKAISKYPEVRATLETEWSRGDGHPDFAYSQKRFEELDIEERLRSKLMKDALDRSKAYRKKKPQKEIALEEPVPKPTTLRAGAQRKKPIKKVIGLFVAVIIIGALLWYAPLIISSVQNYFSQASYTKVTVLKGQPNVVEFDNNAYAFGFAIEEGYFTVATGMFEYKDFSAVEGATYKVYGIEIKVSEVHTDYIVLLVKPL